MARNYRVLKLQESNAEMQSKGMQNKNLGKVARMKVCSNIQSNYIPLNESQASEIKEKTELNQPTGDGIKPKSDGLQ